MKCLIGLLAFFLSCTGLAAQTFDEKGFGTDEGGNTIYQPATLNGDNAYEIGNAGQLFWFAGLVNGTLDGVAQNKAANAVLTADIDMSGVTGWLPIGQCTFNDFENGVEDLNSYNGVFDGKGHVISNLPIDFPDEKFRDERSSFGLFGGIAGTVRNLGLEHVSLINQKGAWHHIGALAGMVITGGLVEYCYADDVTIDNLMTNAGGFVGGNYNGTIKDSYVGKCELNILRGSEFVGSNRDEWSTFHGTLIRCASSGTLTNHTRVSDIEPVDCYTDLTTEQFASGEVCWLLNGKAAGEGWRQNIGGETADAHPVLNQEHAKVYACYSTTCPDAAPEDTYIIYTNTETDLELPGNHPYVNGICSHCQALEPATQAEDGWYEVSNAGQLYWFAGLVNGTLDGVAQAKNVNMRLTADIVVNSETMDADAAPAHRWIQIQGQNGIIDGQYHTISGLHCTNDLSYGRVGLVYDMQGTIRNLGIVNSYFGTGQSDAGSLVGCASGALLVENCFSTAIVKGGVWTGGLGGQSTNVTFQNCYFAGHTTRWSNVGGGFGIYGCGTATVINCYYKEGGSVQVGEHDTSGPTSAADFLSGKVAYALGFRQNLSGEEVDENPVLDRSHAEVYGSYNALGAETYSNDANKVFASIPTLTDGAYQIANASELRWFAGLVNGTLDGVPQNTAANAVITDDIDLNPGITFSLSEGVAGGTPMEWTPMGSESQPYTGTFDGQSHTIKGMAFTTTKNNSGFFGYLGEGADVKHFTMDNFLIQAENVEHIGAIAGYAQAATLTDIIVTGEGGILCTPTKTAYRIGGLVGRAQRITIGNCQNDCDIIGNGGFYLGGIIGETRVHSQITNCANYGSLSNVGEYCGGITPMLSSHCSIADCVNEGNITDVKGGNCGGVVGVLEYSSTMTRCQNKGNINQVAKQAGGVVGVLRGAENTGDAGSEITYCVNSGNISIQNDAGGLVAQLLRGAQVSYSINLGNVSGASNSSDCIGGVAARLDQSSEIWQNQVTTCYSLGNVTKLNDNALASLTVARLADEENNSVRLCFAQEQEGQIALFGETVSADQVASGALAYRLNGNVDAGICRQNLGGESADAAPVFDTSHGLVYGGLNASGVFAYANTSEGFWESVPALVDGIYQIANITDLRWFSGLVNGTLNGVAQNKAANAVLTADIDMSGVTGWVPIGHCSYKEFDSDIEGSNNYKGVFDGKGHVISNFAIDFPDEKFREQSSVFGLFGGIAGTVRNLGLEHVSLINQKGAWHHIGALAGMVISGGLVEYCYANDVSIDFQNSESAGLVGGNFDGTIKDSYTANCEINSSGGADFVAENREIWGKYHGTLIRCFTSGKLYYENRASDIAPVDCYENLTTEQFASGEVCWLLNGKAAGEAWRQNIGGETADARPVLNQEHAKVYAYYSTTCPDAAPEDSYIIYTNTETNFELPGNHPYVNGFCSHCQAMQPATLVTDADETQWYEVGNAGQLYWFAGLVNGTLTDGTAQNDHANLRLVADIVDNEAEMTADCTPARRWLQIDNYYGNIDGQHHTISGLHCTNDLEYGNEALVGFMRGGSIKDLGIVNSYFGTTTKNDAGSFIGIGEFSETLIRVTNCFSTAIVQSNTFTGGLAGNGKQVVFTNCYFAGRTIKGGVEGAGKGFAGYGNPTADNCYYKEGSAYGATQNSGLPAATAAADFESGKVAYLLNARGLSTTWRQNLGTESADASPVLDETHGIVYYGEKVDEKGVYAYTNDRLSVSHTHVADADGWCHLEDDRCNGFESATFNEEANAYDIENAGQLFWFAALVNGALLDGTAQNLAANARLTRDITVNEGVMTAESTAAHVWKPIAGGNENITYEGTFDGQNHTISGLFSNLDESHAGLVGKTTGTVKNVGVVNSYFYAHPGAGCCAPIVARLRSNAVIEHCFARNSTADCLFFTSGICGFSYPNSRITDCYVDNCHLIGKAYLGGLVGQAAGEISRCVAQADFNLSEGATMVGHLVGKDDGASVSASYYIDAPLAASDLCVLGEAKTAEEMASGAVVALLNDGREASVWGQRLGEDLIPRFINARNEVLTADVYVRGKKSQSVIYNRDAALTLPEVENAYVVMNAAETVTGRNVILREGDVYTCADLHISNASAFTTPFAFTASKATFHIQTPEDYVWANGTGGWHSICVPFDGDLYLGEDAKYPCPSRSENGDYWLKEYKGFDAERNTLLFDYATTFQAGVPYIIAFPGATRWPDEAFEGQGEITVRGTSVSLPASAKATDTYGPYLFAGTLKGKSAYSPDASGGRYLLNEEGTCFNLSYSAVPAYSAYIFTDVLEFTSKRLSIADWNDATTTQLDHLDNGGKTDDTAVYDLRGRRVASSMEEANRLGLPRGVYIVGGKKVMR